MYLATGIWDAPVLILCRSGAYLCTALRSAQKTQVGRSEGSSQLIIEHWPQEVFRWIIMQTFAVVGAFIADVMQQTGGKFALLTIMLE